MNDRRNTHFKGFAELLAAEIADTDGWQLSEVEHLIARRAFAFACHIVSHTSTRNMAMVRAGIFSVQQCVAEIPDMAEWTKANEEAPEEHNEREEGTHP